MTSHPSAELSCSGPAKPAVSLESDSITVRGLELRGLAASGLPFAEEVDPFWRPLADRRAERLECLGEELGEDWSGWHKTRARGLKRALAARQAECGQGHALIMACDCKVKLHPCGCGSPLCPACAKVRGARMVKRLEGAMTRQRAIALDAWRAKRGAPPRKVRFRGLHRAMLGLQAQAVKANAKAPLKSRRPQWTMLTLTVRHTGDVAKDRETLADAWQRFRKRLGRECGWRRVKGRVKALSPAFAVVWEFTAGDDGLGHVHAHLAALLPWVDWAKLQRHWREAARGESSHLNLRPWRNLGKDRRGGRTPAQELGKYLSKAGQLEGITAELAAAWLDANYARRTLHCSVGFWAGDEGAAPPVCPCCGKQVTRHCGPWPMAEAEALRAQLAEALARARAGPEPAKGLQSVAGGETLSQAPRLAPRGNPDA